MMRSHMAKSKILYCSALNSKGLIVSASQAVKGEKHFCPLCTSSMLLKRGKQRRPHFSHQANSSTCTSEGVLHFSFKNLLHQRIDSCIKDNAPLPMSWNCHICHESHQGDLLKKANDVKQEYDMKFARPDIALLSANERIVAVIEVVVTHQPEEKVRNFYKSKNIPLVKFELSSDAQLSMASAEVLKPTFVSSCLSPKCPNCNKYLYKRNLVFCYAECYKCGSEKMPQAFIHGHGVDYHGFGSKEKGFQGGFTNRELHLAIKFGVKFSINREHYSFTWDLICPLCRSRTHPYEIAYYEEQASIETGYYCDYCSTIYQKVDSHITLLPGGNAQTSELISDVKAKLGFF